MPVVYLQTGRREPLHSSEDCCLFKEGKGLSPRKEVIAVRIDLGGLCDMRLKRNCFDRKMGCERSTECRKRGIKGWYIAD